MDGGLHRIRALKYFDEFLDHRVLRALGLHHELDGKARILNAGIHQATGGIESLRGDDEMRVALGNVHIAGDAYQLWPLHFNKAEFFRVLDNVVQRAQKAHPGLELDQPRFLQQQQATPLVHRIIGNAHLAVGGHGVHGFVLERIQAHIGQKTGACTGQLEAVFLHRVVQKRLVLEEIDVQIARVHGHIRRRPIGELHHFHLQPLGLGVFGGSVDGIGIHARQHANLQGISRHGRQHSQGHSSGSEKFFQMGEHGNPSFLGHEHAGQMARKGWIAPVPPPPRQRTISDMDMTILRAVLWRPRSCCQGHWAAANNAAPAVFEAVARKAVGEVDRASGQKF